VQSTIYNQGVVNVNMVNISIDFIIIVSPFFVLYRIIIKKYFSHLPFIDREFWKSILIIAGGIFYTLSIFFCIVQLLLLVQSTWLRPIYINSASSLFSKEAILLFISEGFIMFGMIAIANFFNNLRKHVKQLKFKEQQLGKTKKIALSSQAELDALQARINPHFLYNSLNSIACLAPINPAKTEEMALALSEFYRYTTNRMDQYFHTIEEELTLLKTYLSIEKNRFEDKLIYHLQVNQKVKTTSIPRFLLQPLVENAIKYGYNKEKKIINIIIEIEEDEDCLHLKVRDDGQPFSTEMDSGYGLRSIQKKLKLLYPQKHEINFINEPYKQVHIVLKS